MVLALAIACLAPVQATHCTEIPLPSPPEPAVFTITNSSHRMQLVGDFAVLRGGSPLGAQLLTYTRSGPEGEWEYRSTLLASASSSGPNFAVNLDLDVPASGPPTLMVSDSTWENGAGVPRGRVLTYEWDSTSRSWGQIHQLLAPVGGPLRFGHGMVRDGEWMAVTTQTASSTLGEPLFLFRRGNGASTWSLDTTIPDPGNGWAANALALRDDILVANTNTSSTFGGNLRVFLLDPQQGWIEDAIVDSSLLGITNIWRVRLLEGEILFSNFPQTLDDVRTLRRDHTGTWDLAQVLDGSEFPGEPTFYFDFDVSDQRLVVGDRLFGGTVQDGFPGRVTTYVRDAQTGDWVSDLELKRDMPLIPGELFGRDVAVDGHRVLIANDPFGFPQSVFDFNLQPEDCDGDGNPDICQPLAVENDRNGDGVLDACQQVGSVYCVPANPNSTGTAGRLGGLGSADLSLQTLDLCADRLPMNEFGYLLASSGPGFVPNVAGSSGNLCLAGGPDFGRYVAQVASSGAAGITCIAIDLPTVPTAQGPKVLVPGDSWYFQFWYRDGGTSNHTPGVMVEFQ